MAIRTKDYENITDANIQKVIDLLNAESPITKKDACEILNIRYNTTRLQKIIDDYLEVTSYRDKRRSQNRGKGATRAEITQVIEDYLDGHNISDISARMYRSPAFCRAIIERVGVPPKLPKSELSCMKHRTAMLPQECVEYSFEEGEVVWAVRENKVATIIREYTLEWQDTMAGINNFDYEKNYGCPYYRIHVRDPIDMSKTLFPWVKNTGYSSGALAYDLGSLRHLEQYGVNLNP
jgi:hypothetical protein